MLIGVGGLSCWLVSWLVSWLVGRVCWLSWLGGCGWLVVVAVWLGGELDSLLDCLVEVCLCACVCVCVCVCVCLIVCFFFI